MLKQRTIALASAVTLVACTSTTTAVPRAMPIEQPQPSHARMTVEAPTRVQRVTLHGDANFETDSATLTPSATHSLDRLIDDTRGTVLDAIRISGYTDSSGSTAHNQDLSEQRALSVAQYLAAHGLKARRSVQIHGYGEAEPVSPNTSAEGRAQNRRVEIVFDEQNVKTQ